MLSRLARLIAAIALAAIPLLIPSTSVPAAAFGAPGTDPALLGPAAQGDPCPEPNDTFQNACYLGPGAPAIGYLSTPTDVDAYRIEVLDFHTEVHVEMPSMPAAYKLYLADWNGGEIASSVIGPNGAPVIDARVSVPGAYYIFVHSPQGGFSANRPYELFRALTYPGASIPDILLAAEFREGSKEATTGDFEHARHVEEGGRYSIAMKNPGTPESPSQAWWTGFGPDLTDFTMTLDARVVNQVDAGFQVFFRHVDDGNTYSLAVDAKDGQVLLLKLQGGETVANTGWIPSPAVNTGGNVNRVVVRCFEDQIRVYVNGEEVFHERDSSFRQGRIGIGAIAFGEPPVISFDNLIITTPTEGQDIE